MKPSLSEPVRDGPPAEADSGQLLVGDHAVLARGNPGCGPIAAACRRGVWDELHDCHAEVPTPRDSPLLAERRGA